MNVIYMHTHDSGRYLDPANAPIPLPNLERLAGEAVTFRNAFCAAPTCSPSRSALVTGISPHANGMVGLAHRGFELDNYDRHIARIYGMAGAETVLCGVQHVAPKKERLGYQRVLDEEEDYFTRGEPAPADWDRRNAGRVATFLRSRNNRPFFLSYGLLSTHRPFPELPANSAERRHRRPPPEVPDTPETRMDMERFLCGLEVVDECVGIVLEALAEARLSEETAIILTTDHGPPFPRMKGTLREGGVGVSLLVRVPGIADGGTVKNALVSQLDLYPTLTELVGVRPPEPVEGRSLLPLLRGETDRVRSYLFAETNYHAVYEPARMVRTEGYKLIRRYEPLIAPPPNTDDSPGKEIMGRAGLFGRQPPVEELFDLFLDPQESTNLVGDGTYREAHEAAAAALDQWMRETGDPLLEGAVPRPAGSRVNAPDAWSAEEPTKE